MDDPGAATGNGNLTGLASISVFIPTYHCAACLRGAVECCLEQGDDLAEVIVDVDGPTDGTDEVLDVFADRTKVKMERQPNGEISRARTVGVAASTGSYLRFLDADHEFLPKAIGPRLAATKAHPQNNVLCSDTLISNAPVQRW